MISRRNLLKRGAGATLTGSSLLSTWSVQAATASQQVTYSLPADNGGTALVTSNATASVKRLQGSTHPKFVNALPNPGDPLNRFLPTQTGGSSYVLKLREFRSQIGLVNPAGQKLSTLLWGYGTQTQLPTSPGRTFSVRSGSQISVSYVNELGLSPRPAYRLPLDTTLMWANPGNLGGLAPVPLVAHRHGGDQPTLTDGLPDGWSTSDRNLDGRPDLTGRLWSTAYTYDHQQEAGHLWYHDHALGVTRLNVFMGLAGHYFIRDANEDRLVQNGRLPGAPYEVPLAIQDRMYDQNGSLFYPSTDPLNPTAPATTHLPEFFGDFIIVNGVPWPQHAVEPRSYRLRVLNGSDSRFYDLQFRTGAGTTLVFHQVGTELGLMNAPVPLTHLVLAPGERADLVVSFKGLSGKRVTVYNAAPTPFPNGQPVEPSASLVMAFNVTLALDPAWPDTKLPNSLRPVHGPLPTPYTSGVPVRKLLLVEGVDPYGRLQTLLGTVNPAHGNPVSPAHGTFFYSDPVTERMARGSTEIWEFHNTTVDAHPIHLHQTSFRVLNRQPFDGVVVPKPMGPGGSTQGGWLTQVALIGPARPPSRTKPGARTRWSPTRARSPASWCASTVQANMSGIATSSRTKTTR